MSEHPYVIGFFETVVELAGVDPASAFSLTMTRRNPDLAPETIVLSQAT